MNLLLDTCTFLWASGERAKLSSVVRDLLAATEHRLFLSTVSVWEIANKHARGEIARTDRSHLAGAAQPYQDLIDRLFYEMAGLTEPEWRGLEERLARML